MIETEFMKLYEELSKIQEARVSRPFPQGYVEAAEAINLNDCRMIASDVMDIRGELEESACLEYKGVLTRVAASVLPFRDGPEGKEVFLKLWRSAVYLLGGGVDLNKDRNNPINTVARESFEECNMTLNNIKDSGCSYWEYSEKPWVEKHVANPEDRWNGYYTWLFVADYKGAGDNEFPEEGDNFRWHKVSDILARPDTKKLKFIKQAIVRGGYAEAPVLEEEIALTEGKQLGYVSYAIRKTPASPSHPISSLNKILTSGFIKASTEGDGSKYVSLSRNLLSHLTPGAAWKCGLVLDGDKIANTCKVSPVNYNSLIYFGGQASNKQLELQSIAKYQALDEHRNITDRTFYVAIVTGSSFVSTISESTYEVLKTLMAQHNDREAVKADGSADPKYKGKPNSTVKKFYNLSTSRSLAKPSAWQEYIQSSDEDLPQWLRDTTARPAVVKTGSIMQKSRVPKQFADATWLCTESFGYNVERSGLILRQDLLAKDKDLVFSLHGIDITAADFFTRLGGSYADEAEERVTAQLFNLVDNYGTKATTDSSFYGINIEGAVKAILIDEKHRRVFDIDKEDLILAVQGKININLPLYKDDQELPDLEDNTPNLKALALSIRNYADARNIPIIPVTRDLTNYEILKEIR